MANKLNKVAIIGGGYMGTQVAVQCALSGISTFVYIRNEKSKERFNGYVTRFQTMLRNTNKYKEEKLLGINQNITASLSFEDVVSDADIIIEAIIEDVEAKKRVFRRINSFCGNDAIIASNTSTFVPSMFTECMKRPENFACIHFHTYVWTSSVVEVMPHDGTSEETMKKLKKFASRIGQVPLMMKKESANYVFNAIMMEINRVVLSLVSNGVSDIREIDMAWRGIMKISNGPFAIMDMVGLDTIYEINNYWAEQLNDEQLKRNSELLQTYVEAGKLGIKTGEGFYKY